jgi:outer membrane receptor protein involved in Fe transport
MMMFVILNATNCRAARNAQRTHAAIKGVVKDALGRPIADADIKLESSTGKIVARSKSAKDGSFTFSAAPGPYAIVATKPGFKLATSIVVASAAKPATVALGMQSQKELTLQVVAQRLERARNGLSPQTGSSVYTFSEQAVHQMPAGENTPLNQVLLQAPGVAQDSYGQLHIRGEHANIQYRIDGVELPVGVIGFSQVLSPRYAKSVSLLTGALPAQYSYQTAGVIDVQTRSGAELNGGDVEMYGGQNGTVQPSFEYGGHQGDLSYYATGYYLQNSRGIEPPTSGPSAIHDITTQGNGFGTASYFLNSTTKLSLISGFNLGNFEIPANPGQPPVYPLAGAGYYPSKYVRETQLEQNYWSVLALQGVIGPKIDYQIAGFTRYSTISFHPDDTGDLIYNGIASRIFRSSWANGLQGDLAYHLFSTDTIRGGFYFSGERAEFDNHSLVFPGSPGVPSSDVPVAVTDDSSAMVWLYGLYIQNEWHPIKPLTINFGTRFDLYDGFDRADQASPRFAVTYAFPEGTTLHAAYARYFTPPPTELVSGEDIAKFRGTVNFPLIKANGTPSPERANYFDAGVDQQLPWGLRTGVDSYYKMSRDLIDEGQFGAALIYSPFNYEKGRQYGVEWTGSLTRKNLSAYANFAYSVAQGINPVSGQFNFSPAELAYAQTHYIFLDHDQTFSASAGAAYTWRTWTATVDGLYGSGLRSGFDNTGNLPYYIQVNAGIIKTFKVQDLGEVQARLSVINLFDHIYEIRNGSGIGVFAPQYGPRRSFFGSLKIPLAMPGSNTSLGRLLGR